MARASRGGPIPPRDHRMTLSEAAELTRLYRKTSEPTAERSGVFHAAQVRRLLDQPGCIGLRYYHGRHSDGRYAILLVGVGPKGEDLLYPKRGRGKAAAGETVLASDIESAEQSDVPNTSPAKGIARRTRKGASAKVGPAAKRATLTGFGEGDDGSLILENHFPCPPFCASPSPLNE